MVYIIIVMMIVIVKFENSVMQYRDQCEETG